jgi:hypothetical protein
MQFTTLPSRGATCRAGDGRHLFQRELALLHSKKMLFQAVTNLSNFAQCVASVA